MFAHAVHFHVTQKHKKDYQKDCRLWARYARKYPGFRTCYTFESVDKKNEYVSVYVWNKKEDNEKFMNELHDWLVEKSNAVVTPKGYYNLFCIYRSQK